MLTHNLSKEHKMPTLRTSLQNTGVIEDAISFWVTPCDEGVTIHARGTNTRIDIELEPEKALSLMESLEAALQSRKDQK